MSLFSPCSCAGGRCGWLCGSYRGWLNDFHRRADFSAQNPLSDARASPTNPPVLLRAGRQKGAPFPHISPRYLGCIWGCGGGRWAAELRVISEQNGDQTDASLCGGGDTLPQSHHHSLSNDAAADFTRRASSCGADAPLRVLLLLGSFFIYLFV